MRWKMVIFTGGDIFQTLKASAIQDASWGVKDNSHCEKLVEW